MPKTTVTIDGVEYSSRTAAAKALVAAGKSLKEAAKATGMTYQTVYANTKGAEKAAGRRVKYRILSLGKSGKRSAGEIAEKVGVSSSKVVSILKKAGIKVTSAKELAAAKKADKAEKATKKTRKTRKAKATKTPEAIIHVEATEAPVDEEQSAMEAAMADIAAEGGDVIIED